MFGTKGLFVGFCNGLYVVVDVNGEYDCSAVFSRLGNNNGSKLGLYILAKFSGGTGCEYASAPKG